MFRKMVEIVSIDAHDCDNYRNNSINSDIKYDVGPPVIKKYTPEQINKNRGELYRFLNTTFQSKYPDIARLLDRSFNVKYEIDKLGGMNTASTNGVEITCYDWFLNLPDEQKCFVLLHEVTHILEGDPRILKQSNIRGDILNIAADLYINHSLVKDLKLKPPEGLLFSKNPKVIDYILHSPVQTIYDKILEEGCDWLDLVIPIKNCNEEGGGGGGGGDGEGNPNPLKDDVKPQPDLSEEEKRKIERGKEAFKRERMQSGNGDFMSDLINITEKPTLVNWRSILDRYIAKILMEDSEFRTSYTPPSKHHQGPIVKRDTYNQPSLFYPSFKEHPGDVKVKNIFVAIDTSSSVITDMEIMSQFIAELKYIMKEYCDDEDNPCTGNLIFFHDKITNTSIFPPVPSDETLKEYISKTGGTDFSPIFEYIKKNTDNLNDISVLVILTDGKGDYPKFDEKNIPYPVLWVITPAGVNETPFGKMIKIPSTN